MRELGWRRRGERLSVRQEGRGGGSELGFDLDLDPDPWKILWIRIRQNDADPNPQHCSDELSLIKSSSMRNCLIF